MGGGQVLPGKNGKYLHAGMFQIFCSYGCASECCDTFHIGMAYANVLNTCLVGLSYFEIYSYTDITNATEDDTKVFHFSVYVRAAASSVPSVCVCVYVHM